MMMRQGSVIRLRPESIEEYERYHRDSWPEVKQALTDAGFRNYSIYRFGDLLFSYREYHGSNFDGDMARLDAHEPSRRWVAIMQTLQVSVDPSHPGQWTHLPEIYHLD